MRHGYNHYYVLKFTSIGAIVFELRSRTEKQTDPNALPSSPTVGSKGNYEAFSVLARKEKSTKIEGTLNLHRTRHMVECSPLTPINQSLPICFLSTACITPIFHVEEIFAKFANLDFARNFPPAKIISTANGISRNFPPAKCISREIFLPTKVKF